MPRYGEKSGIVERKTQTFRRKTGKSLHFDSFFYIFATNKNNSCRFHLEAYDSCETTIYQSYKHKIQ